jgi:hypothetical protein
MIEMLADAGIVKKVVDICELLLRYLKIVDTMLFNSLLLQLS